MRIGVFKKYWNKFKYNKKKREMLVQMFDDADEQVAGLLQDEFVPWKDEIEGARQFLADVEKKAVEKKAEMSFLG